LIADAPSSAITCVSATDSTDAKASFSSYGDAVDVAAPGINIFTTLRGGGYGNTSGTSFSTPITAGVYALLMAANKTLTPATLDSILFSTAKDLGPAGWDQSFGNGRVDAAAAVALAKSTVATDTQAPTVTISAPSAAAR
jgi:subtilisin family serine protease